jgi:hypothetical protein
MEATLGFIASFSEGLNEGFKNPQIFPRFLEYTWRVTKNIFYVIVVICVLDRVVGRAEHIVIAVLGLIYVSLRGEGLYRSRNLYILTFSIHSELLRIRELLGDKIVGDHKDEIKKHKREASHWLFKSLIDGTFLTLIGIICLWTLWSR